MSPDIHASSGSTEFGMKPLKHVAIIMDGNGRWAQRLGLTRIMGHTNGVNNVRKVVQAAQQINLQVLTLFAFSDENWGRPALEVRAIMALIDQFIAKDRKSLHKNNIKLNVIGQLNRLPLKTRILIEETVEMLKDNTGMILNVAISYSGRQDIVQACLKIHEKLSNQTLTPEQINPELFSSFLTTGDLPEPDLLIRTSGEYRLSNFLLWQFAYTELYFTKTLWPDFAEKDFHEAVEDYYRRDRRFGLVKDKKAESIQV